MGTICNHKKSKLVCAYFDNQNRHAKVEMDDTMK